MSSATDQESTFFAPAGRANRTVLRQDIEIISHNPVVDTVLKSVSGLIAVLNDKRQILAVNETMLQAFGIDSTKLGLRPGEAINCIHAHDHPGGCGTSQACMTCGAAITIVTSLNTDTTVQRDCFVTLEKESQPLDYYFQVQCSPIFVEGRRFLLLFLIDITSQQKYAALERAFFHDIKNLISSLMMSTDLLKTRVDDPEVQKLLARHGETVSRLRAESEIQRVLSDNGASEYQVSRRDIPLSEVFMGLQNQFASHGDSVHYQEPPPDLTLYTDINLLQRVLANMVINALEASEEGDVVRLWVELAESAVTFCVWNRAAIPQKFVPRIFQRNFSTKPGIGRGLGTYTMKLFGETYLGGTVSFSSSEQDGTTFRLTLPVDAG
ncbi:MAG: sensor histidine kinase [Chloroflexi bacterium]|nr:sensor histidine kinase [Chloroflexota bacterium]